MCFSFYLDLEDKLENLRTAGIAVVAVCAVMGTTEESAIDDVDEILNIRDRMRKKVQCTILANIPDDISRNASCNISLMAVIRARGRGLISMYRSAGMIVRNF